MVSADFASWEDAAEAAKDALERNKWSQKEVDKGEEKLDYVLFFHGTVDSAKRIAQFAQASTGHRPTLRRG